jgi:hypothetical protein
MHSCRSHELFGPSTYNSLPHIRRIDAEVLSELLPKMPHVGGSDLPSRKHDSLASSYEER